ncbi:small multidrug efflux protein [Cryobacterium arcticum]|uniref:Small multidrug efflux protein n=1 Tax=Cryobacterium arcticum TaxID=670052 RepID=A0A318A0R2_9MICO|nr:small multidrug efflux protein [Cryobacterium arcticum]PXA71836.1 small multidrug efflux protein [Cryobacterium arcticum]
MSNNPYEGFQEFVGQVPDLLQPLLIAVAGAIPYIEGEGSAAIGVIAGVHPVIAGLAGATGNIICVVLVVLLSSRIRTAAVARRLSRRTAVRAAGVPVAAGAGSGLSAPEEAGLAVPAEPEPSKGRQRLRRWIVRFGVPGASLIAPFALPTQLTAATLVASGVNKSWVILWQVIAIVLWTGLVTAAATGILTVITG